MSVSVNIHTHLSDNNAEFDSLNKTCWLTITSDGTAVAIFGTQQHAEALKMIADIFNDAFAPGKMEPAVVNGEEIEGVNLPF